MAFDDLNKKPERAQQRVITKTRDMTALDDLSHNFLCCPQFRQYVLMKYGQCFENGVRITR